MADWLAGTHCTSSEAYNAATQPYISLSGPSAVYMRLASVGVDEGYSCSCRSVIELLCVRLGTSSDTVVVCLLPT